MNNSHYLLGLLGHPVSHSLSPVLHKAALGHHKLDGDYKLIDVETSELRETLDRLEADGTRGVNVTIPHKQAVIKFLQELSPEVAAIGAVNTIIFERNGQTCVRRGENTDVHGFSTALLEALADRRLSLDNATTCDALLFGYGGAARAVVAGLRELGFGTIKVAGRNASAIDSFCMTCRGTASPWLDKVRRDRTVATDVGLERHVEIAALRSFTGKSLAKVSIAINATPQGQYGEPIAGELLEVLSKLPKSCFVYDLVYSRTNASTPLVQTCEKLDLQAEDGLGMLVHQAAKAFELWTGRPGPVEVMKAALQ